MAFRRRFEDRIDQAVAAVGDTTLDSVRQAARGRALRIVAGDGHTHNTVRTRRVTVPCLATPGAEPPKSRARAAFGGSFQRHSDPTHDAFASSVTE